MIRRRWSTSTIAVAALLLTVMVAHAASDRDTSVSAILQDPGKFDGQMVIVRGSVTNLKSTVSRRGNPYYTYELRQGGRAIQIFSFGTAPCAEGDSATVEGLFTTVKRVSGRTFYNEIEAKTTRCQ